MSSLRGAHLCQENLSNSLSTVQSHSVWRIFQDFSPTTSISACISELKLQSLENMMTVTSVSKTIFTCCVYKIRSGLVDLRSAEGTLTAGNHLSWGPSEKPRVPQSRSDAYCDSFPQPSDCGMGSHQRHSLQTPPQHSKLVWKAGCS